MAGRLSFSIAINLLTENFRKGVNTIKDSFRSIQMQILTFAAALGAGGLGLMGLISRMKDVARETSRAITALKNVSNGTKQFADSLKFVNDLADKYGIEVTGLTESFVKFTASATQAGMSMENQKKIFDSVSRSISAFNLSSDESKGVMLALSQMMGKGKISSEELRKQMGEKLPIAMQAMAKAAGTSMAGLETLLKQGKLMSADILPKFAEALNEMIPEIDTNNLETSLNRLQNAFGKFVEGAGVQDKYKAIVDAVTKMIETAGNNIKTIVQSIAAVIIGISANSGLKILKGWDNTAKQMMTNSRKLEAEQAKATAERVAAQNALDNARLNHSVATGRSRQRAAEKVAKAEILFARAVIAEDKANLALQQVQATQRVSLWNRSLNTIKVGIAKFKVALKGLWTSFAPMIIITAITLIGQKLYEFATKTSSAEKAMQKFNSEALTESKNLNSLFDAYKKANDGTKEKDRLLNLIKSKYGEYIKNLIDEKGRITDIDKAQRQANESLRQSIALRVKNAALSEIQEDEVKKQSKSLGKIRDRLADKLGDDSANDMIKHIGELMTNDSKPVGEIQREITDYIKAKTGESQYVAKYTGLTNNDLFDVIGSVQKVRDETRKIENQFKGIIGDYSEPLSPDIETPTPPGDGDSNDKTKRAAERRADALRKLDEADKQRQIDKLKFDFDMRQREIDLMDDSFDKRIKQINLNHERENQAIEEFQKDIAKSQLEYAKNQYISVKGSDIGFGDYFSQLKKNDFKDSNGEYVLPEGLRPENIQAQVKEMNDAARKEQQKGLDDITLDLMKMLEEQELMFSSDLDRKLAELDDYYNEQKIKAGNNAELIAQIENNRKRAKTEAVTDDKLDKIDFDERLESERLAGMESIGMTELVEEKKLEITKLYIQKRIDALKPLADAGDIDAKNQIELLESSLKNIDFQKPAKGLKALADKKLFDTITKGFQKMGSSPEEAEEKTTKLFNKIRSNAANVVAVVGELQSAFGGLDDGLDMAMEAVGNIASGFAQGGIIGGAIAAIGEGIKLFGKASEASARHQEALREILRNRIAEQRQYNLLLLEQNLLMEEAVSIFGEKLISKAANSIDVYRESMSQLKEEMQGDFKPNEAYEKGLEKAASSGGIMSQYFRNQLNDYRKQVDAYEKGIAGLYNAEVVTGHKKTGLFGWGKGKDTYSKLLDVYDDVIDKEGNLNTERLQTIINTQKMSDDTKAYLQNLIDLEDKAKEAQEALRDYLESTFGALGNDIMTSLEDAIKNKGVDAWEAFGEAGSKVIENLGKQIAYELFLADKFKKVQEDLESIYGSGKDKDEIARDAMDLIGQFYQNIGDEMDMTQKFMENWKKEAEKYGFDLWKSETDSYSQSSSKGGFDTMTQDQAGALEGRFTGLYEIGLRMEEILSGISLNNNNIFRQTLSIVDEMKKHTDLLNDIKQIQLDGFFEIEGTAKSLKGMDDKLDEIKKNTKGLISKN